jgi:hypothetical protein
MSEIAKPPVGILLLLWPFKGERNYPQIVGDLNEEYRQRAEETGIPAALRWYRREIWRTFWVLTWRPVILAAIVVPLVCVSLLGFLTWPLLRVLSIPWRGLASIPGVILAIILCCKATFDGFVSGAVASRILPGLERIVRVMFTAFYVTLAGLRVMVIGEVSWLPMLLMYGRSLILTVPFVWAGSIWVERRNRRRAA